MQLRQSAQAAVAEACARAVAAESGSAAASAAVKEAAEHWERERAQERADAEDRAARLERAQREGLEERQALVGRLQVAQSALVQARQTLAHEDVRVQQLRSDSQAHTEAMHRRLAEQQAIAVAAIQCAQRSDRALRTRTEFSMRLVGPVETLGASASPSVRVRASAPL